MQPLFETILSHIDPPEYVEGPTKVLVSSIDYNDYVGRIAIGRIERGSCSSRTRKWLWCDYHNPDVSYKAKDRLHVPIRRLAAGACRRSHRGGYCVLSRALRASTSATPCATPAAVEAVPFVKISEPTVEMIFSVNDSPFAGREGKFVTSRQIRERLDAGTAA